MIRPLLLILSVERKTKSRDLEKKFKRDTSPYKNIISEHMSELKQLFPITKSGLHL